MRFIATFSKGAILTDDYDVDEIMRKVYIKHLMRDIKEWNIKSTVTVYDEKNRFVCKLNYKMAA